MPFQIVLLLIAVYGVGLWAMRRPVQAVTLANFAARHGLDPEVTGGPRLTAYLTKRRRMRVAGLLVAMTVGLWMSVPDSRVQFSWAFLTAGWLVGSIVAEYSERDAVRGEAKPMPSWFRQTILAVGVVGLMWTVVAVPLRSDGVALTPVLAWGVGGLAAVVGVLMATRYASTHALRNLHDDDMELGRAITVDAVRGLTLSGTLLALLCLSVMWFTAVPGPYDEAFGHAHLLVAVVIGVAVLFLSAKVVSSAFRRPAWIAVVVIAAVPLAWAVPMRLAQVSLVEPHEVAPVAQMRLARIDRLQAARVDLGLKPTGKEWSVGASERVQLEIIGRVELAKPAPEGSHYLLFAFDRNTKMPIMVDGPDGSRWSSRWTRALSARYDWLSTVLRSPEPGWPSFQQFSRPNPMATAVDSGSGMLWFHRVAIKEDELRHEEFQLVLMLVRDDGDYVYWATPVPSTLNRTFATAA